MVRDNPGIQVHTIAYGLNRRGADVMAEMSRITRGSHVGYELEEINRMAERINAGLPPL